MDTVTLAANSQAGAVSALYYWMRDKRPLYTPGGAAYVSSEVQFEDSAGDIWAAVDVKLYALYFTAYPLYRSQDGDVFLRGDTTRRRAHMGVRARWRFEQQTADALRLIIYRSMRMFRDTQNAGILAEGAV